jgi:CBS domain-containing protein
VTVDRAEIAGFLRRFPPFDAAPAELLDEVAAAATPLFLPAGTEILSDGADPADHVYVLHSGHAVVLEAGEPVDDLVPGDVFGLTSMLSGQPVGHDVRAATHVVVHQVPADAVLPLLSRREGLRFVAGNVRRRVTAGTRTPAGRPFASGSVARVMRRAVVVSPTSPVRDAVAAMTEAGATAVLVEGPDRRLGICTDHDLRSRVLATGLSADVPVGVVATAEAVTIDPGAAVDDALVAMTEGAFRHLPVVDATGAVLGLVEDTDLLASHANSPLHLRRAALRATSEDGLVEIARRLPDAWIAAAGSRLGAVAVTASVNSIIAAVLSRAVGFAAAGTGVEHSFAWLVTGSLGRREALPCSDVDSVLVSSSEDEADRRALAAVAERALATLRRGGLTADSNGVAADDARSNRSLPAWRTALAGWTSRPDAVDAVIYICALLDARAVRSGPLAAPLLADLQHAQVPAALFRRLGKAALGVARPPASMLPEFVGIERHRRLDLKRAGVAPVTHLARWAGYQAGSTALDTTGRLADAATAGVLVGDEAVVLTDAFAQVQQIRLRRQAEALADGQTPSDGLTMPELDPLTRRELREIFRAVLRIQDDVHARLDSRYW